MFEQLSEIIEDIFGLDGGTVTEQTSFETDLGADLQDMQELFLIIEEEFDVLTSDDDIAAIETVTDLEAYITRLRKEQAD